MARFRINIFYLISSICLFILVGYVWFIFLPMFEYAAEYEFVKNIVLVMTVLLSISAIIQLFLSITKKET